MTDEDIIKYFITKNGKINASKMHRKFLEKDKDILEYLNNRFKEDFSSYTEVIARIFHKIEEKPKCKICGKDKTFHNFTIPYTNNPWCSKACQLRDKEFQNYRHDKINYVKKKEKYNKTMLERYGDINYRNSEKRRKTCFEKYGSSELLSSNSSKRKEIEDEMVKKYGKKTITNIKKIKETKLNRYNNENFCNFEQIKKTMLERYGCEYTLQSKKLKDKVYKTKLLKYGDEKFCNKEKTKQTILNKYGVENVFQLKEVREKIDYNKILETKKNNKTFNSSKAEDRLEVILIELFGRENVYRNYKDKRYINEDSNIEYICDFYIKNCDLFIELQGHYTHGSHPFDENNDEDIKKRELYLSFSKEKPSYKKVVDVWCGADVKKRNIANKNHLNYIEIFGSRFTREEIIKQLKDYII